MKKRRARFIPLLTMLLTVGLVCLTDASAAPRAHKKTAAPAPPAPVAQVGTRFGPGMLTGYEEIGGGMMSDEVHRMTDCAIHIVRKDGVEMVWLSRVTERDPSGQPIYQITDILRLPERKRGEIVAWFACCYGGRTNDSIIAYTDKYYYRVFRAWLANRKTGRIEEVSTRGIVCQDPATVLK